MGKKKKRKKAAKAAKALLGAWLLPLFVGKTLISEAGRRMPKPQPEMTRTKSR